MSEVLKFTRHVAVSRAPSSSVHAALQPARDRAPTLRPLPAPPRPAARALDALLATLDERARKVLETLTLGSGATARARLATDLGITLSQLKHIESSAPRAIRKSLRSADLTWLHERVSALRERWGDIVPRDHDVTRALLRQTFDVELSLLHQALVVWLAGPYTLSDGWFTFNEKSPQAVARALLRRAAEGDVRPEEVTTVLDRYGVARVFHAPLLEYASTFSTLTGRATTVHRVS